MIWRIGTSASRFWNKVLEIEDVQEDIPLTEAQMVACSKANISASDTKETLLPSCQETLAPLSA